MPLQKYYVLKNMLQTNDKGKSFYYDGTLEGGYSNWKTNCYSAMKFTSVEEAEKRMNESDDLKDEVLQIITIYEP